MCQKGDLDKKACGMPQTYTREECFRCDSEKIKKVTPNEIPTNIRR